jgi:hypothetical protein
MTLTGKVGGAHTLQTTPYTIRDGVHISPAEWRWVMIVGGILVLLAFVPLLWVILFGQSEWRLMGTLPNFWDGASYFSKMRLGFEGQWLVTFQHTAETHSGAFIQTLYPLLGHISRWTSIPFLVLFHVARAFAALFMYVALYQLGAMVWSRVTARRLFFGIAAVGSGFGWLFSFVVSNTDFPDFALLPEAYPFFSSLMNAHFPLTIACLALLAGLCIGAFRPGADRNVAQRYGWAIAAVLSFALCVLYPQSLVPFAGALLMVVAVQMLRRRKVSAYVLRYPLAVILPAIPFGLYILAIVSANPAMQEWNRQNVTAAPPPLAFLVGFGLPLLLAVPAILRAVRRFDSDGDRLMLFWLLCMIVAIYLPTNIQRRFAVGMMIPIAYFATWALMDFWLPKIRRTLQRPAVIAVIATMAISPFLLLILLSTRIASQPQSASGVLLQSDYADAFAWLDQRGNDDTVILAAPSVSAWIPAYTGHRVIYGHPYETLYADERLAQVQQWYSTSDPQACSDLLNTSLSNVRYVLYGAQEAELGGGLCNELLRRVVQFGDVIIYAP